MIPVALSTLAAELGAEHSGADVNIDAVVIDTRKVVPGCLFVALQGERFDGHDFAQEALRCGVGALLVNRRLPLDIPQLLVSDTRLALGALGGWMRRQVSVKTVALTGSAGKTSVKEMTAAILGCCGAVLYTEGNLNNDIGVPLTLLRLTPQHQYAVVELGANHRDEIAYTVHLVCPESVLINNLAASHLEGFGSLAGVAQAKGEILTGLPPQGTAIINADSHDEARWLKSLDGQRVWHFSPQGRENIDFYATDIQTKPLGLSFTLHTPQGNALIHLPLPGQHNVTNALAAAALAMSVGASLSAVSQGLAQLRPVPGRLFPLQLADGKILLDDTYNANVASMLAAVETLASMPGYRVLVVGDMGELGEAAAECHHQIGISAKLVTDKVLSVGVLSQEISMASGKGEHFTDQVRLIRRLAELCSEQEVISVLVKGSRSAEMERVIRGLQEMIQC